MHELLRVLKIVKKPETSPSSGCCLSGRYITCLTIPSHYLLTTARNVQTRVQNFQILQIYHISLCSERITVTGPSLPSKTTQLHSFLEFSFCIATSHTRISSLLIHLYVDTKKTANRQFPEKAASRISRDQRSHAQIT